MKKIILFSFLILLFASPIQANFLKLGGLDTTAGKAGYEKREVADVVGSVVNIVLSFLGVLFVLLMIYGGIMWMTAQGNEIRVSKAQKLLVAAVIGLIVVVSAFAISSFVGGKFSFLSSNGTSIGNNSVSNNNP